MHCIPGTTDASHGPTLGATTYHKIYVAIKASGVRPPKDTKEAAEDVSSCGSHECSSIMNYANNFDGHVCHPRRRRRSVPVAEPLIKCSSVVSICCANATRVITQAAVMATTAATFQDERCVCQ